MTIVVAFVLTIVTAGIGFSVAYGTAFSLAASGASFGTAAMLGAAAGYAAVGAIVGAATGALGAALAGGDLGDVLRGAAIGGISGALTGAMHVVGGGFAGNAANIVGHGVIGGAANVAMGGKFQDGFLSAAASAAAAVSGLANPNSDVGKSLGLGGRTLVASTVGGTASALGGGKFANGALTGAMHHLLNAEAEDALGKMARKFEWSPERRSQLYKYYLERGLQATNQDIDNLKNALYVNDETYRAYIRGDYGTGSSALDTYERIQANKYQSLEVAIIASAGMDPNFKFSPDITVTGTIGYSFKGVAYQKGIAMGTSGSTTFTGYGASTPRLILSLNIGPGSPPMAGTTTTSISGGYIIGGGYEGGAWSGGFTWPGAGIMRNTYSK